MESNKQNDNQFLSDSHSKYLKRCLQVLPESLASLDISRLTIAFFAISGLDLLNRLDLIKDRNQSIIDWIYSLQILPQKLINNDSDADDGHDRHDRHDRLDGHHGFRGSSTNGSDNHYDCGNLAMTYCALSSLLILGDDLNRVDKTAIINGLKYHQLYDGSFVPVIYEKENDMRFVYCAATICYILQDWSSINIDKTINFIKNSLTYENAFGQGPGLEAHGGSTYCALAALTLIDKLNNVLNCNQIRALKRWCLLKQYDGFEGRPNKDSDTCYSFWIGAALKLIDAYDLINIDCNERFILATQDSFTGGLAKYPDSVPDPMHTYLGLSGLALNPANNCIVIAVNPALNISERAVIHLKKLHQKWTFR